MVRAVLDTNVLISALIFGGKPRIIFGQVLQKEIIGVTSPFLLAELSEILTKKFKFSKAKVDFIETKIREKFMVVNPTQTIDVLLDTPDNRVLEAALEGKCAYIITGDKQLLALEIFENIKIITAAQFLDSEI